MKKDIAEYVKDHQIPQDAFDYLDRLIVGDQDENAHHDECHNLLADVVDKGACEIATQIEKWILTAARLYAHLGADRSKLVAPPEPVETQNPAVKSITIDSRISNMLDILNKMPSLDEDSVRRVLMAYVATDGPNRFFESMAKVVLYTARLRSDLAAAKKGDHFAV